MHGRRLAILIAGNFFVATSFMSVSGLLNEISGSLQLSVKQAGMLIAAFAVTAGIAAPILATSGSRIDRRLLLTTSLVICSVANLLGALSTTYDQLLWTRVLAALTSAVYTPQVAATVSMLVGEKERGPVLAKLMMGWAIGAVIGGPLTVLIGSQFGWRVSFALIALGGAIIAFYVWKTVPFGVRVPALNWQRWIDIARTPALVLLTATTLLHSGGNHIVFSYIAPTMLNLHNASGDVIAALFFVNGLGGVAGSFLAVYAMQRFGVASVSYTSIGCVALVFALWPLGALVLPLVFVMQFFWNVSFAGFPSVQQTRFVTIAPTMASATIALNSSVGYLGGSLGAAAGGRAWNVVGPRYLPWMALLLILASLGCSYWANHVARHAAKDSRLK